MKPEDELKFSGQERVDRAWARGERWAQEAIAQAQVEAAGARYAQQLTELNEAATPGPWRKGTGRDALVVAAHPDEEAARTVDYYGGWPVLESATPADLELIAFLRNAAPELAQLAAVVRTVVESDLLGHPDLAAAIDALDSKALPTALAITSDG